MHRGQFFDLLRLSGYRYPSAFDWADCIETDDADLTATDPASPDLVTDNGIFYYLVRGESACSGTLGEFSTGIERYGRTCP